MFEVRLTLSRVKKLAFDLKFLVLNVSRFKLLHEGLRRGRKEEKRG